METNYYGVDLSSYHCHKLQPLPIYSNYTAQNLHYPIGAIQKGFKPHTKIGINRIQKRNLKKKGIKKVAIRDRKNRIRQTFIRRQKTTNSNLKKQYRSPQQNCMKALRTQFRRKLQANHRINSTKTVQKTQAELMRKQNQRTRRKQLIMLVKVYKQHLVKIFGIQRFKGFGRCPKISRQQIWKALNFTASEKEAFYDKYVYEDVKTSLKEEQNCNQQTDYKLLRLSTHSFKTIISVSVNQNKVINVPYPFPNRQIFINLNTENPDKMYQFYPIKQQRNYFTRYVSLQEFILQQISLDSQVSDFVYSQGIYQPYQKFKCIKGKQERDIWLPFPFAKNQIFIKIVPLQDEQNLPFLSQPIITFDAPQEKDGYAKFTGKVCVTLVQQDQDEHSFQNLEMKNKQKQRNVLLQICDEPEQNEDKLIHANTLQSVQKNLQAMQIM